MNDLFLAVHDYFGHVKDGVGMRADGEENAWPSHSAMYSEKARWAMTSETRGQNSWVNFGPHAEANATAGGGDTVYADQKVGLLPKWVMEEGAGDYEKKAARLRDKNGRWVKYDANQPRDESGRWTDGGGSSGGTATEGSQESGGASRPSEYNELVTRLSQPDGGFTYQPVTAEMPTRGFALPRPPSPRPVARWRGWLPGRLPAPVSASR